MNEEVEQGYRLDHPGFFRREGPFTLAEIASQVEAELGPGVDGGQSIDDVRTLADARPQHISFVDNRKYLKELERSIAGACLVSPALASRVPDGTAALHANAPYRSFALALQLFYPEALRSQTAMSDTRVDYGLIHATARIDESAVIESGAIVGREAEIGRGARIAAGAVIGYRVVIGVDSYVGPSATVTHALVGDRVVIQAGARVGLDGFGFAMGPKGNLKVPQIGRVIIQDDVEIGANSTVDRGSLRDTIIGESTKIDNLVQIGHNAIIGRHCVLVSYVGISGSSELGDFVVMAAKSGVIGHLKVGSGAQIAVGAHVLRDVASGARMAGQPAVPFKDYARGVAMVKRLSRKRGKTTNDTNNV